MRNGAWLHQAYQDYVVVVDFKTFEAQQAEHLCQVRKLGADHLERSLMQLASASPSA